MTVHKDIKGCRKLLFFSFHFSPIFPQHPRRALDSYDGDDTEQIRVKDSQVISDIFIKQRNQQYIATSEFVIMKPTIQFHN